MRRRSRVLRWVAALLATAALVAGAVAVVLGRVDRQTADDPRSATAGGSGALGQLLADEGVQITTTHDVEATLGAAGEDTTVVVAASDQLTAAEAQQLSGAPAARLVLLRPTPTGLASFAVRATTVGGADIKADPQCASPAAQQAGPVSFDLRAAYRPTGAAELRCYPTGDGFGYLRTTTTSGRPIDLVAGGLSNAELAEAGNAAFAMNLLGERPRIVWLVARTDDPGSQAQSEPTLLPPWWGPAAGQAVIGLVIVGVWRGRRLGPILTEPLPVRVRAAETVEGHGRLYDRLDARDRAAEALRQAARTRLTRAYGHAQDPLALSNAVAARTGGEPQVVRDLLFGPAPTTDDQLMSLSDDLDRLEQEARQP